MGHSMLTKGDQVLFVRDSTFEVILEQTRREVLDGESHPSRDAVLELVAQWYEYWWDGPPGAKRIDFSGLEDDTRSFLREVVDRVGTKASAPETTRACREWLGLL